ncbi:MAG: GWxTD domain-containing protein [Bacteroidota bacterium]
MTMLRRHIGWILAALAPLASVTAWTQVDVPQSVPQEYSESLFLEVLAFRGQPPGESRIDAYLQVGYDNLSFVKAGDRYDASYEATLSVSDSAGSLVSEKSWNESIKGVSFDESVSPTAYALLQRSFTVKPGRYTVTAFIRDLDSKATKQTSRKINVPDFHGQLFAMSDIMLVSRLTVKGTKKSIMPNVSPNVGDLSEGFYTFCEVYNRVRGDTIRFVAQAYDNKGEVKLEADTVEYLPEGRNEVFLHITKPDLPMGDYDLTLRAFPREAGGGAENVIATRSRKFIVRWKGMPKALKDIDLAIEQLQYIAKDNELDELKSAKTPEEKQKKFLEFWQKRDPNPNTPRNEKMEEFYGRVAYANKHFSHYREGWKTDMGMVFIILGPPNNVERHPFEIDSKPYEIWSYYDLNYQYVFVDQSGFGDYRLVSPLWEVYNRRRD